MRLKKNIVGLLLLAACSGGDFAGDRLGSPSSQSTEPSNDPEPKEDDNEDKVIAPTVVSGAFLTCAPLDGEEDAVLTCSGGLDTVDASELELEAYLEANEETLALEETTAKGEDWKRAWIIPEEKIGSGKLYLRKPSEEKRLFETDNEEPKTTVFGEPTRENVTISTACEGKSDCYPSLSSFVEAYDTAGSDKKDLIKRKVRLFVTIDSKSFTQADKGKVVLEGWNTNRIYRIAIVDPTRLKIPGTHEEVENLRGDGNGYYLNVELAGPQIHIKANHTSIMGLRLQGWSVDDQEVHGIRVEAKYVRVARTIIHWFFKESGSAGVQLTGDNSSLLIRNSFIQHIDGSGIHIGETGVGESPVCGSNNNIRLIVKNVYFSETGIGSWPTIGTNTSCENNPTGSIFIDTIHENKLNGNEVVNAPNMKVNLK